MQFHQVLVAAVMATFATQSIAAPEMKQLYRRNCPLASIAAVQQICEEFLGVGNNESRKCQRLFDEVAAQNCLCTNGTVLYDATSDNNNGHAFCSTVGPCWF